MPDLVVEHRQGQRVGLAHHQVPIVIQAKASVVCDGVAPSAII